MWEKSDAQEVAGHQHSQKEPQKPTRDSITQLVWWKKKIN